MCRQERAFKMDKQNKIDFQTSSGGGVSCFRNYRVHKFKNHRQEETKKPLKNNDNVEIEVTKNHPNKHLKFKPFFRSANAF